MQLVEMSWRASARSGVQDPSESDNHHKNTEIYIMVHNGSRIAVME